jgi:hypothetical protein
MYKYSLFILFNKYILWIQVKEWLVVKQKMCSEFSDVVLGWYKRRTWHLKKWSFFQIQKETVALWIQVKEWLLQVPWLPFAFERRTTSPCAMALFCTTRTPHQSNLYTSEFNVYFIFLMIYLFYMFISFYFILFIYYFIFILCSFLITNNKYFVVQYESDIYCLLESIYVLWIQVKKGLLQLPWSPLIVPPSEEVVHIWIQIPCLFIYVIWIQKPRYSFMSFWKNDFFSCHGLFLYLKEGPLLQVPWSST